MKRISKIIILTLITLVVMLVGYNKSFALTSDYDVISSSQEVVVDLSDKIYTGSEFKPEVKLRHPYNSDIYVDEYKDKYVYLKEGKDYTVEYYNNKNVGTAKIVIKGIGKYTGNVIKYYKIVPQHIKNLDVKVDTLNYIYTGNERRTTVKIYDNNKILNVNEDYTLTYKNNTEVGVATVIIKGINNYTGNITNYYNIIPKKINDLDVQVNTSDHKYKAEERRASVKIYDNTKKLKENKDYTLRYENNIEVGIAKVFVNGINNYKGIIIKEYKIVPQNIKNADIIVNSEDYTYSGKARKAWVKVYYKDKKLKEDVDYKLQYKNVVDTGKAQVTIIGINNFSGKIKKTYRIVPKKASIKEVIMNSKNTQATITWKKDSQADGYVIYRATSKNGEYKKIKNISDKNKTSYTVKKLSSDKMYYFKIRSYKMFGDKKGYSKKYSDPKTNSGLLAEITLTATTSSISRNTNLKVASKAINGLILKTGQTFNWFNVVGKATVEKGYKSATVFVDKKPVPGVGGGICQVSTTLYQAAKKARLKMVERHTHSLPVTYTTKGNDATVAYGVKNLRIRNNKKYSIKFVTTSNKNKTTCKIYRINN